MQLLLDSASPNWKNPEIEGELKRVLGESLYEVFVQNIQGLGKTILSLKQSMHAIADNPKRGQTLSIRKLKWALEKDSAQQELKDLSHRMQILALITDQSVRTQVSRQSLQAIQNTEDILKTLHQAQRVAQNVEALATGEVVVPEDFDDTLSTYTVQTEVRTYSTGWIPRAMLTFQHEPGRKRERGVNSHLLDPLP